MQNHTKKIALVVVLWMWFVPGRLVSGWFETWLHGYLAFPVAFLALYLFLVWCFSRLDWCSASTERTLKTFLVSIVVMWLLAFVVLLFPIKLPS
jgi:hypothetical protein